MNVDQHARSDFKLNWSHPSEVKIRPTNRSSDMLFFAFGQGGGGGGNFPHMTYRGRATVLGVDSCVGPRFLASQNRDFKDRIGADPGLLE